MTDQEFLRAFEECTLAEFHHADHIRMAWLYLRQFGFEEGSRKIVDGIKRFAAAHQQHSLYHDTITLFWIRVVWHAVEVNPQVDSLESILDHAPFLRNSQSIYYHYSRDFLGSEAARAGWRAPDLAQMPFVSRNKD